MADDGRRRVVVFMMFSVHFSRLRDTEDQDITAHPGIRNDFCPRSAGSRRTSTPRQHLMSRSMGHKMCDCFTIWNEITGTTTMTNAAA